MGSGSKMEIIKLSLQKNGDICAVLDVLERYTMHRKHRLVFSFTYERVIFPPY